MYYWIYTILLAHYHRYEDVLENVVHRNGTSEPSFGLGSIDAEALLRLDAAGNLINIGGGRMCGIVAYDHQFEVLLTMAVGIKNLGQCGNDSAGINLQENGRLDVHNQPGEMDELDLPEFLPASCSIGHTL